jgi:hypothetical protein
MRAPNAAFQPHLRTPSLAVCSNLLHLNGNVLTHSHQRQVKAGSYQDVQYAHTLHINQSTDLTPHTWSVSSHSLQTLESSEMFGPVRRAMGRLFDC